MKAEIKLTDSNGEIHLSGVTIKARLIEFIDRHWTEIDKTEEVNPFSFEARLRRLEDRMKNVEFFAGTGDVYSSESSLDSRIERLEDWRRDSDT